MKRRHLFLLTASLALTTAAVAQTPGPGPGPGRGGPPMMRHGGGGWGLLEFDANADGKLTRAEFDASQKARFNELDGNKDGSATPEEVQAAMQVRFQTMEKEHFTTMDTDKNGQLSFAELQAGRGNDRGFGPPGGPEIRMRGGPGGPGVLRFPGPGGPDGPGDGPRRERAGPGDADSDGKVTFAEFTARSNETFTRADANKDGTVTIAELQALARGPR